MRACVRVQAASATRHAETRRSTSVEVEPTTSAADTERPAVSGARSVERLHQEPPAETAATTPLLARLGGGGPERAPRPPPPRRRGDSVTRHGDAGSKDSSSKSSSSNNNNVEPPPPPAAVEATSAAAQYVEFGSRTTTTVTAAVVELAPSEVAAAPPAAEPGEPGPHVYCYTTAPPAPSQAEAEPPVVAEESPRVPPWPRREEPAAGARRPRCRHCDEPFEPAANRRGACPDAPDAAAACVERASCVCCARALVYHCLEPHDGDQDPHDADPCACDGRLGAARRCRRWTSLGLLSLVVPCLCLYWPLAACHRCAVRLGCCGGRHSASPARVVVV